LNADGSGEGQRERAEQGVSDARVTPGAPLNQLLRGVCIYPSRKWLRGACVWFLPGFLDGVGQGLDVVTIHTWNELTVRERDVPAQHHRRVRVAGVMNADVSYAALFEHTTSHSVASLRSSS
jgi:hypothetical protein